NPGFTGPTNARPVFQAFEEEFDRLDQIAETNFQQQGTRRIGRRLYLYFAGHGVEFHGPPNQPALLMANATRRRLDRHVGARAYADWFIDAVYFDEVVLFFDCCREIVVSGSRLNRPHVSPPGGAEASACWFFGFAVQRGRLARERHYPEIGIRGDFTQT